MTAQPEFVRHSELLNQLVIHRDTLEELGRVETLWMYAPSHRVLGFICKSGFLGGKKLAFNLAQVSALGENGILTQAKPQETDSEKVRQLESVIHCEIWSDSGEKIGKVIDYRFNLRTGEIAQYLFTASEMAGPIGEIYELFPSQILSIGQKRVLIPDYATKNLSVYREGLKRKLTKATEFLKEDYTQVTQELKSLTRRAQETSEQVKGRWRNLTEQVKQRAQSFSQQAQETVQNLNEQLREEAEQLVEQAKETSHVWSEQLRDQTQTLSHQMEDGIQTLTVQAREILDSDEDDVQDWGAIDSEDPEAFFDNLFQDEDTPQPAQPETQPTGQTNDSSTAAPDVDHSASIDANPDVAVMDRIPEPTETCSPPAIDPDFDSLFNDLWDEAPTSPTDHSTPSTPSSHSEPAAPTPVNSDDITSDEDDEQWV